MSAPPTRALASDPSPAPSLPPSPGEGRGILQAETFEGAVQTGQPTIQPWSATPSSPGEGGREGAGEEGRGGEGWAGALLRHRLTTWAKILSAYFTTQTLVQLTGIAAGLLFVNFMPVREFALYTLAFSVITFFNFITDLGSSTSLVYFFHRTAKAGEDFQPYFRAVFSLRRLAFLVGAAGVLLAFPRMAAAKGYGLAEALLAAGGIVLCVWFQIASSLRVLSLRLVDRYGQSYRAELAGGLARLLLAALLVTFALLKSWLGVLASAAASAVVALLARPKEEVAPADGTDLRPYRRQVLRYLLPSLPSALYFSIQAPLTIWLATTFGSTTNMAEVGALGRLGMVVGIFSGLTGVVFLPRLARIVDERRYRQRYLQFGALLLAVATALVATAAVVPDTLLWLLGPHYAGLHRELLLVVGAAGLTLLGGYTVSVNLARSWNRWEGLAVALLIVVQACLVAVLPLGNTAGVLLFNLVSAAVGLLLQLVITAAGFSRPEWVRWMT
jgi:hypothetical protein